MTRGHAVQRPRASDALMPVELFLTVFAELEDALQWTIESLTGAPTHTATGGSGPPSGAAALPEMAQLVGQLLASLPPERKPARLSFDAIILGCLELARFRGNVAAVAARPRSSAVHEHARKAIVLTAEVLSLHVLRSRGGAEGSPARPGRQPDRFAA